MSDRGPSQSRDAATDPLAGQSTKLRQSVEAPPVQQRPPQPAPSGSGDPAMDDIFALIDKLASLQDEGPAQLATVAKLKADMGSLNTILEYISTNLDALLDLCQKHRDRGGQIGKIMARLETATASQRAELVEKLKNELAQSSDEMQKVTALATGIKTKVDNARPGLATSSQQGGKRKTRRHARKHRGGWRVRTVRRGRPGTKRRGASFRGARRTHRRG